MKNSLIWTCVDVSFITVGQIWVYLVSRNWMQGRIRIDKDNGGGLIKPQRWRSQSSWDFTGYLFTTYITQKKHDFSIISGEWWMELGCNLPFFPPICNFFFFFLGGGGEDLGGRFPPSLVDFPQYKQVSFFFPFKFSFYLIFLNASKV